MTTPMLAVTLENGCFIQLSHKLTVDGYIQRTSKGKTERFHRTMWKHFHGEIPEGYEIDHLCNNRACFNVEHLQCLSKREHSIKSASSRWAERRQEAFEVWDSLDGKITGRKLGEMFGVSRRAANKWVRKWKGL